LAFEGEMAVMTQAVGWNYWLALTLFVAFGLRLGLALAVQHEVAKTPGRLCLIAGDAEGYWELATHLSRGEAYSIYDPPRRLLRMPGFPLLLAISRGVVGDSSLGVRIVLALVGTLAVWLTYRLGVELSGQTAGLLAALYTALSPSMNLFSVLFLSETAFAAGMLASLVAVARLIRQGSEHPLKLSSAIQLSTVSGLLVGLATYLRPTWLLMGPGLAMLVAVTLRQNRSRKMVTAGLICLTLMITLTPWTIRNAMVTGHLIPTTLWVGPSLYDGLHPGATGDSDMTFFEQDALLQTMSEYEMDREYRQRAWSFAAENPRQVAWLAWVKQTRFWSPVPNTAQFQQPWIPVIAWLAFTPLILLSLIGAWYTRQDLALLFLTAAPLLYFAALHLLFVGSLRYRLPAEYPLAVLAAVGLTRLFPTKQSDFVATM